MRIVENVNVVTNIHGKTKAELIFELVKGIGDIHIGSTSVNSAISMYDNMVSLGIIKELKGNVNITKEGN